MNNTETGFFLFGCFFTILIGAFGANKSQGSSIDSNNRKKLLCFNAIILGMMGLSGLLAWLAVKLMNLPPW